MTLDPALTLRKATLSPRVKPYTKPVKANGAGGTTVVTFNDVQRKRSKAKSSNAKRFRPVKVTVVAQLSKSATAGSLPAAITATLCGGPVASVDVRGPLSLLIGLGFVTLLL